MAKKRRSPIAGIPEPPPEQLAKAAEDIIMNGGNMSHIDIDAEETRLRARNRNRNRGRLACEIIERIAPGGFTLEEARRAFKDAGILDEACVDLHVAAALKMLRRLRETF